MSNLQDLIDEQCNSGAVPGAVAVIAAGDEVTVAVGGTGAIGGARVTRQTLFRIASITKPIVAAATMALAARVAAWSIVHGFVTLWQNGNVPEALGNEPTEVARLVAAHLRRGVD